MNRASSGIAGVSWLVLFMYHPVVVFIAGIELCGLLAKKGCQLLPYTFRVNEND